MKYELQDFKINVSNLEIKCRPWTSLEERKYISNKSESTTIEDLVRNMILPNIEYQPMTLDEFKYLAFKMRALSVNPALSFNYQCDGKNGCQRTLDQEADLDDLLHLQESSLQEEKTIQENDIEVTLRRIPTKELMLKVLAEKDPAEQKYLEFLASIKKVKYKNETHETFTFDELKEFFDSVSSSVFQPLYTKFFDIKGHLRVFKKCICPICKKETIVTFDGTNPLDFL